MNLHDVVLIAGDGIGPEVTRATRRVFEAAEAPIRWIECQAGLAALDDGDEILPEATIEAIADCGVALKGPCTTPVGAGFRSVNVGLRKRLELYAAVRPVRNLPGLETRFRDVDLVVVRENTEGLYSGIEYEVTNGVVASLKVATEAACTRIARWAFDFAAREGRERVTVFHKANIMKLTDGLLLDRARAIHDAEFPSIVYDDRIIDAGCMQLVQDPTRFDVLLLENLYGDVVSDLCAGLVGGLGVVPGANFGDDCAVFEAVHGSAPDIAGRDLANPTALLMSGVMLLEHLARSRSDAATASAAKRIDAACRGAIAEGMRTRDLGGGLGTEAFTDALVERVLGGHG